MWRSVRPEELSFSAEVRRSQVSGAEKNFAPVVGRRSRTEKSAKLSTALCLEKQDSTHVINGVLFRIVSDLQSENKLSFLTNVR